MLQVGLTMFGLGLGQAVLLISLPQPYPALAAFSLVQISAGLILVSLGENRLGRRKLS